MTTATLHWTDPTTDVNGVTLPAGNLTGVDIFNETGGAAIGHVAPGVETFTTDDLPPGDYVFTVVAINSSGAGSPSNAVSETVGAVVGVPAAITDLTVTMNA